MTKQTFNFGDANFWILAADAFARDVAGHFMQVERDAQPLFAGHLAIAFDLFVQCRCRIHEEIIANLLQRSKIIQPGVGAKRLRRETVPRMTSTLKGLNHLRANGDATPLGLNLFWVSQPRVARSSRRSRTKADAAQPWAIDGIPLGLSHTTDWGELNIKLLEACSKLLNKVVFDYRVKHRCNTK